MKHIIWTNYCKASKKKSLPLRRMPYIHLDIKHEFSIWDTEKFVKYNSPQS